MNKNVTRNKEDIMGYNYKQIAESVVKCIGGQKNIKSVQHCATVGYQDI